MIVSKLHNHNRCNWLDSDMRKEKKMLHIHILYRCKVEHDTLQSKGVTNFVMEMFILK